MLGDECFVRQTHDGEAASTSRIAQASPEEPDLGCSGAMSGSLPISGSSLSRPGECGIGLSSGTSSGRCCGVAGEEVSDGDMGAPVMKAEKYPAAALERLSAGRRPGRRSKRTLRQAARGVREVDLLPLYGRTRP